MRMKKRYLFPVVYIILVALSFVIKSEGLLILLNAPMILLMLGIEISLDIQFGDGFYFVILGGIMQFFLLGYLWDFIAEKIRNKKYWDTPI